MGGGDTKTGGWGCQARPWRALTSNLEVMPMGLLGLLALIAVGWGAEACVNGKHLIQLSPHACSLGWRR